MGSRRRGREAALRVLYQSELSGEPPAAALASYLRHRLGEFPLDDAARRFAEALVLGVERRRGEIDGLLAAGSAHWRLERMAVVDRNVLRLALFELLDQPDTPAAVILDEAVELAKLYGGEESGAFVNGVLDGIRRRLEAGEFSRG